MFTTGRGVLSKPLSLGYANYENVFNPIPTTTAIDPSFNGIYTSATPLPTIDIWFEPKYIIYGAAFPPSF